MFGNCCGCSKKQEGGQEKPQSLNENATLSDKNVIDPDSVGPTSSAEDKILPDAPDVGETAPESSSEPDEPSSSSLRTNMPSIIVEQPRTNLELTRQSTLSDTRAEDYDNDDDVFCEGVAAPMKLADNLGTPYPLKREQQAHVPLPRWFSEEEEQEIGGIQEPPATPVGRDELALRRYRFFSELINAAQGAAEHKVRFDPLGPVVAGVLDQECHHSFSDLETLVSRLETVADRLETIYVPIQEILKKNCVSCSQSLQTSFKSPTKEDIPPDMSVAGFQDVLQGPFATYLVTSQQIGGDVATHSALVERAFQAQLQYLTLASQSKAPAQSEQIRLLQPTSQHISAIQDFREKNRTSLYFNHLSAISESVPALGWVTVTPAPAPYVKEMNDAGQFYTNRVLKDWKEKDKKHVDWVKSWIQTLSELQSYVKQHHTTGLVWAGKNVPSSGAGVPPPPPPGCPPPPPILLGDVSDSDSSNDRSALFAQINQGENITKNLKKVTADMQTHKNPTLRTGPAPFKAPQSLSTISTLVGSAAVDKPPVFTRDGKKWLIEYQKGNHNLLVDNAEMNNVVYLYKCSDSTIIVKGKINSITLDSCKKTSIVFDAVVSAIEFINCQSVQMQVFGKVPTISVDKTDGCQMYLSPESMDVEVISSKSSEMNVLVPKSNGDYSEYPVPEQYKTTVSPSGLNTIVVESKG